MHQIGKLKCVLCRTFVFDLLFWGYIHIQHILLSYIPTSNLPLPHLDLGVAISWTWWSGHSNLTH